MPPKPEHRASPPADDVQNTSNRKQNERPPFAWLSRFVVANESNRDNRHSGTHHQRPKPNKHDRHKIDAVAQSSIGRRKKHQQCHCKKHHDPRECGRQNQVVESLCKCARAKSRPIPRIKLPPTLRTLPPLQPHQRIPTRKAFHPNCRPRDGRLVPSHISSLSVRAAPTAHAALPRSARFRRNPPLHPAIFGLAFTSSRNLADSPKVGGFTMPP